MEGGMNGWRVTYHRLHTRQVDTGSSWCIEDIAQHGEHPEEYAGAVGAGMLRLVG
jgi:hypothetical protein